MKFEESKKMYWWELRFSANDWAFNSETVKKFLSEMKQLVPKKQRKFIKSKDMWLIHLHSKRIVQNLIEDVLGGQQTIKMPKILNF